MAWVRLDDGFPVHPKVVAAGEDAAWLYVAALCWCNQQRTDGRIPVAMLRRLTTRRQPERLADRLVLVQLWERTGAGFQIHDYHEYQPTAEQLEAKRLATLGRVLRHRNADRNAVTPRAVRASRPVPSRPDPQEDQKENTGARMRDPTDTDQCTPDTFAVAWERIRRNPAIGTEADLDAAVQLVQDAARVRQQDAVELLCALIPAMDAELDTWSVQPKARTVATFVKHFGAWLAYLDGKPARDQPARAPAQAIAQSIARQNASEAEAIAHHERLKVAQANAVPMPAETREALGRLGLGYKVPTE